MNPRSSSLSRRSVSQRAGRRRRICVCGSKGYVRRSTVRGRRLEVGSRHARRCASISTGWKRTSRRCRRPSRETASRRARTPRRTSAPPSRSCRWPPERSACARRSSSEAEALMNAGIEKICMTTSNPSVNKIRRAMQLRKRFPHFIQAVDEEKNARDLSAAAKEARHRRGRGDRRRRGHAQRHPGGDDAVALAKLVDTLARV